MRPMTYERGEGPSEPMKYDPLRYARYRMALEMFPHPDTETHYGHPTPEELERAYSGEFDDHPSFAGHLAETTHWCGAMSTGPTHGGR